MPSAPDRLGEQHLRPPSHSLSLQMAARRFAACSTSGDVDLRCFVAASYEFAQLLEAFGPWTESSLKDARRNLLRIEEGTRRHGVKSMQALLRREASEGSSKSGDLAEAMMWARIQLKFWVEVFDQYVTEPSSLPDELMRGFDKSLAAYFFGGVRVAFSFAAKRAPDWDRLPCARSLAASKTALSGELRRFVSAVRPLLRRMHSIQSSLNLEDPRTPLSAYS